MSRQLRTVIVLAAGGTGGHMFPAEALARELGVRGFALALMTDRRGAAFGEGVAVEVRRIHAAQIAGNVFRKAAATIEIARGYFEARRLLRELSPAVVVGFGGYASLPTMLAAIRSGILTLIHEQNAVLGRANRLLASKVDAIATSFEQVQMLPDGMAAQMRRTGNPVRSEIAALSNEPYPAPQPDEPLHILITGGSQGAAVFGALIPSAVALLAPEQRARLRLVQQCRPEHLDEVGRFYEEIGVAAVLRPFSRTCPTSCAAPSLLSAVPAPRRSPRIRRPAVRPFSFLIRPPRTITRPRMPARSSVNAARGLCPSRMSRRKN